jgi:hypothetical protein
MCVKARPIYPRRAFRQVWLGGAEGGYCDALDSAQYRRAWHAYGRAGCPANLYDWLTAWWAADSGPDAA